MAPSAAPAPTSVWSSSMKRMIWPCESSISLRTAFEPVFELTAIFCSGQHGAEIERDHALVLQRFGNVAGNDALGEAFDDGGLADTGLADQHGIIFRAAREDLDHAADFFVASDDGIEFAAAGLLGQVAGVFVQGLELGLGILVGNFLRAADDGERFQNGFVGRAMAGENLLAGVALKLRDGEQQVLGRDVFVLEVGGLFEGLLKELVDFIGERDLSRVSGNLGKFFELFVDFSQDGLRADADFFEHGRDDAFLVLEQRGEQVNGAQLGIAMLGGELVRALDGFLRFDGEFIPTDGHNEPRISVIVTHVGQVS